MTANGKVVINLATGLEDAERVTVAFLVGVAAVEAGKQVAMFLTKGAVLLAWPGGAEATACEGCPPFPGSSSNTPTGEASCSSVRSASRRASSTSRPWSGMRNLLGRRRSWEWIGEGATVFSY